MIYIPNYIKTNAIGFYLLILVIISIISYNLALPFTYIIFSMVTVLLFFIYLYKITLKWEAYSDKKFINRLFLFAFFIRTAWVLFSYQYYQLATGKPFEFSAADSIGYHLEAVWIRNLFDQNKLDIIWNYYSERLSDAGYTAYLSFIYSIFGDSILIARLIKAFIGSITVVLIYKVTVRNFGEKTGRIAGILALLYPNLIYYTGLHVKETEMVFILVLFIERLDLLLRKKSINFSLLIIVLGLGALIYFFRAVLAYCAFISLLITVLFSRIEIFKLKNKISIILIIILFSIFMFGNVIINEATEYWGARTSNQEKSLKHRTKTNRFAQYGSSIVFVPIMFVAPFPTFVNIEDQQNHMLLSGGYYVKNILAFFVLVALYTMFKTKRWQEHVLILAITFSYLVILAMSKFAIVERFHMPILPFHIILTSYGISQLNRNNLKNYNYYLLFIAVVIISWNWFKLAGRGLI